MTAACSSFPETMAIVNKAAFGTQQHMPTLDWQPTDGWTSICLGNTRMMLHLGLSCAVSLLEEVEMLSKGMYSRLVSS